MKAVLKHVGTPSCDFTPKTYQPIDYQSTAILLDLEIGELNKDGADYFQLFVCTPEWLCKNHWQPEIIRHMLIVRKYNYDEIVKTINEYIDKCSDENWEEIANKLSRYFAWEFEDYQP